MLRSIHEDETGAGLVEYSMLVILIALVALAAVRAVGPEVDSMFIDTESAFRAN